MRTILLLIGVAALCEAQSSPRAPMLLTNGIDESRRVALHGNTRQEANRANDAGAVDEEFRLDHLILQLRRPAEQQEALEETIEELHDPSSPNFHKWLTAEQFGERFGLAGEDLYTITSWLESHGFTVHRIYPNLAIDFSGTAKQIRAAFRTEIHHLFVNGKRHYGNINDPEIPAALARAVVGIASLHDFMPQPLSHPMPAYTLGTTTQAVVPADIATIYNLNPAFAAGFSGQGQTIAVLEDSNIYSAGDWLVFRKVFGLARPYPKGNLVSIHPGANCINPGLNGDNVEAILDAEWATAAAPNATIAIASCANTSIFGGFIALQNLLAGSSPPAIVSIGFGMAEAELGAANNAFIKSLYQMAAAEGVSIFVSSGDSGAAFADGTVTFATHGIAVNGYASTPYNVAVGATDFADTYFGTNNRYWNTSNTATFGSARSYIPETTWNDSCASALLASSKGFATTYGTTGYCNQGGPRQVVASGGGPSACATGSPTQFAIVSGTCAGYAKPSWQSVFGNPSDGVRDLPDVSLFGSNGVWGHYYVICFSDVSQGGKSCLGAPNTWNGFGGTSVSAPLMAGIQALVNQKTGSRWGNPNPVYYRLASLEYGASGSRSCNSVGSAVDSGCTFYDVTLGDIDVNCRGTHNCFFGPNAPAEGVLSTSNSAYRPAFNATTGWDFATGIGSVNAWNLLRNWSSGVTAGAAGLTAERGH